MLNKHISEYLLSSPGNPSNRYESFSSLWITTWCSSDLNHNRVNNSKVTTIEQAHRQKFNETPFMNASDMDDMLFECNKNAIYVLNSNYAYGEFGRLNLFGASSETSSVGSGKSKLRTTGVMPRIPSSPPPPPSSSPSSTFPSLYRSSSTTLVSNNRTTEVPNVATAQQRRHQTMSTTLATTIPKLFQYSHSQHQPLDELQPQHENCHLHNPQSNNFPSKCKTNITTTMATTTTNSSTISSSSTSKKSSYIKSTIIAKKTKFWKYLEEEKWKKTTSSMGNLTVAANFGTNSEGNLMKNNNSTISSNRSSFNNNNNNSNNHNNNYNNSSNNSGRNKNTTTTTGNGGSDSTQKSSSELYKEAAELLGLSCTLCDNCRCLDCQSRYFECDDSDSYSELSFLGDYLDSFDSHHQSQFQPQANIYLRENTNPDDECRISRQSDSSSVCSVNSNHSDEHRDLSYDESISMTN